jgi:N-acetyl-gamma-glutamylphosphate reductase
MRVLIVGGYGIFGGRLVELLEHEPRLTLLVSGRSLERAREFCALRVAQQSDCEDQLRRVAGCRDEREGQVDPALGKAAHEIARSAGSRHEMGGRQETDRGHDEARRREQPDTAQRARE